METLETGRFFGVGSHLALDFLNTKIRQNGEEVNLIASFAEVVEWLATFEVITPEIAASLKQNWAREEEKEETDAFAEVLRFREFLREVVEDILGGRGLKPDALARVNTLLRKYPGYSVLVAGGSSGETEPLTQTLAFPFETVDAILAPFVFFAAELLSKTDWSLIRRCESPDCVLYFYDTTKNHARRWCSMSGCGNRHKAAKHYEKVKSQKALTQK